MNLNSTIISTVSALSDHGLDVAVLKELFGWAWITDGVQTPQWSVPYGCHYSQRLRWQSPQTDTPRVTRSWKYAGVVLGWMAQEQFSKRQAFKAAQREFVLRLNQSIGPTEYMAWDELLLHSNPRNICESALAAERQFQHNEEPVG